MTFSRANAGGWSTYEVLTSTQANTMDLNISRALDGYAGGTYEPSAILTWRNQFAIDATYGSGTNLIGLSVNGKGSSQAIQATGQGGTIGGPGIWANGGSSTGAAGGNGAVCVGGIGTGYDGGHGVKGTGGLNSGAGDGGSGGHFTGGSGGGHGVEAYANTSGYGLYGEGAESYGVVGIGGTISSSHGQQGVRGVGGDAAGSNNNGGAGVYGRGGDETGTGTPGYGGYFEGSASGGGVACYCSSTGAGSVGIVGTTIGAGGSGVQAVATAGYGIWIQGDATSPSYPAMHIAPQDTQPTALGDGDIWVHTNNNIYLYSGGVTNLAMAKARATVHVSAGTPTIDEEEGCSTAANVGNYIRINFDNNMNTTTYSAAVTNDSRYGSTDRFAFIFDKQAGYIEVGLYDISSGAEVNLSSATGAFDLVVFGDRA